MNRIFIKKVKLFFLTRNGSEFNNYKLTGAK
nr:MAG TPA: hypothetical protein [Caudoviricetes sp.]